VVEKEPINRVTQIIECPETSLIHDGEGGFGFHLSIENSEHKRTLVKLRDLFANISGGMELEDDQYSSGLTYGGVSKLTYKFIKEGDLEMPWEVKTEFIDGKLHVSYGVELQRPNGVLGFNLRKNWDPVLNTPVDSGIWSRNNRVKVDALPAFLFVEKWKGPQYSPGRVVPLEGVPEIVRIENEKEKSVGLSNSENGSLSFVRKEYLRGSWSEIWIVEQSRSEMKVTGVSVNLKRVTDRK